MQQAVGASSASLCVARRQRFASNGIQELVKFLLEGQHIYASNVPDGFRDGVEQFGSLNAETSFKE